LESILWILVTGFAFVFGCYLGRRANALEQKARRRRRVELAGIELDNFARSFGIKRFLGERDETFRQRIERELSDQTTPREIPRLKAEDRERARRESAERNASTIPPKRPHR
jgi:hypothetical protein